MKRYCNRAAAPRFMPKAILNVCKSYVEPPLACASVLSGTNLKRRIARIMTQPPGTRLTVAREMLLATAGFVALAAPVGLGLLFALHISAIAACHDCSVTVLRSGHDQAK